MTGNLLPSEFIWKACACRGPFPGDLFCPCEMQRRGLEFDVSKITWTEDDRQRLVNALAEMQKLETPKVSNLDRLLQLLSSTMPTADTSVTPNGSICLEWDCGPDCQLTILLKEDNQIAFATYIAGEKAYGSTQFSSQGLPDLIDDAIKNWLNHSSKENPNG